MTYLTFANFFTVIYGWIAFWTFLCSLLMISRKGKDWADYDVILFRVAVCAVTSSVFVNRVFNTLSPPPEPPITPYLFIMIIGHLILAYAAAATSIRIAVILWRERDGPQPGRASY